MSEFIEVRSLPEAREEIRSVMFAGQRALERAIDQAREDGEEDLLARLQEQYREHSHAARMQALGREVEVEDLDLPSPEEPPAVSADESRIISGWGITWGTLAPSTRGDRRVWLRVQRGCFSEWLRERGFFWSNPASIPLAWRHDRDGITRQGSVVGLREDGTGLRVTAELAASPAGDEILRACDDGRLGFSLNAPALQVAETGESYDDAPILDVMRAGLEEVSVTPTPFDRGAIITTIGGRECRWMTDFLAEQHARDLAGIQTAISERYE